jgi:cobalt/nickel transport system permease protein
LRQARIERWSRGDSSLHRRHAAAKILVAFALLISIGTLTRYSAPACALYLALLLAGAGVARLPVGAVLWGATVVLPFALCFAVVSALAGDPAKAVVFVVRAWLSAQVAILLVATTPMPQLIAGLEALRLPRFLLQVMQFLYRYLTVLAQEAGAMIQAGSSRAGTLRTLRFREAAAIAGVLFARSYARAQAIHRAMVSRGFEGRLPAIPQARFQLTDAVFGFGAVLLIIAVRGAFGWA